MKSLFLTKHGSYVPKYDLLEEVALNTRRELVVYTQWIVGMYTSVFCEYSIILSSSYRTVMLTLEENYSSRSSNCYLLLFTVQSRRTSRTLDVWVSLSGTQMEWQSQLRVHKVAIALTSKKQYSQRRYIREGVTFQASRLAKQSKSNKPRTEFFFHVNHLTSAQ